MGTSGEITELLHQFRGGDKAAESRLLTLLYNDLRRIAANYMRRERAEHTLQPTALVHEAWLQIAGRANRNWNNRAHFLAVAAQTMRTLLIDHARGKHAQKRGGGPGAQLLSTEVPVLDSISVDVLDLERVLSRLERLDPRQCQIVIFRYYGGMTDEEIGEVLSLSVRTVRRDWRMARAWLYGELQGLAKRVD